MDARVKAIRDHALVGRGSCTDIDECWEDEELLQELDFDEVGTESEAIIWALDMETGILEQRLNHMSGESDAPLEDYNVFVADAANARRQL